MNIIINSKIKSKYQQKEFILKLNFFYCKYTLIFFYCKYTCLCFKIINNNNFYKSSLFHHEIPTHEIRNTMDQVAS